MAGVTILLSVTLLAITLTTHCVLSLDYDEVNLIAGNKGVRVTAEGRLYSSGDVEKLSNPSCCLVFDETCDISIPNFRSDCRCNVVHRRYDCHGLTVAFYFAVLNAVGDGVILTAQTEDYRDKIQDLYNLTSPYSLSIPVIFVNTENSRIIWSVKDDPNITLNVEVIPTTDSPPGSGLENTRSATTFYFVVFAFTILLLLSLTWFVFNYLRRCHHMYTLKRQRVS